MAQLDEVKKQLKKAEARVQRLEARERESARKADARRSFVVGAIALQLMRERFEFREWFLKQLDQRVVNERDRALLQNLVP